MAESDKVPQESARRKSNRTRETSRTEDHRASDTKDEEDDDDDDDDDDEMDHSSLASGDLQLAIDAARGHESQEEIDKTVRLNLCEKSLADFPRDVLKYRNLTELDLADNNIRRLPSDIRRLRSLVRLDLSRNPLRSRTPDDFSGLPREFSSLAKLSVLVLSECCLRYVPPAVWSCRHLAELDVSRNKLNVLPPDIGQLESLVRLDVRSTGISMLPSEVVYCQQLAEIMLSGNVIQSLPDTVVYLAHLRRLDVDFRRFASTVIDDFADGLLRAGKFESEHLPTVLFQMPAIELLDLDATRINRLPVHCSCPLREFRLARNYFRQFPAMIAELTQLEILDISGNQLTDLPPEVGRLVSLKTFSVDDNEIERLPDEIGQLTSLETLSMARNSLQELPMSIGSLKQLKTLNVSRNQLASLPSTIADLNQLQTLDVTGNQLTSLPSTLYRAAELRQPHSFRHMRKDGLWLHRNPIADPAPDVWMTTDRRRIYDHLVWQSRDQFGDRLSRTKIVMLGNPSSGKSSFIEHLVGKKLFRWSPKTGLIQFFNWSTNNAVKFLIGDVRGTDERRSAVLWPLFFDDQALHVVVYDHSRLRLNQYHDFIGRHVELILLHCPRAVVQIVGTKIDRFTSHDAALRLKDQVETCLRRHVESLAKTVRTSSSGLTETDAFGINVRRDVLLTSAVSNEAQSRAALIAHIEGLVMDENLFPEARQLIDGDLFCEMLRRRADCYWLPWNEVENVARECNVAPGDDFVRTVRYLHRTGQIYWSRYQQKSSRVSAQGTVGGIVFPRPRRLVEILEVTFRCCVDAEFLSYEKNRQIFYSIGGFTTQEKFDVARLALLERGLASKELLACVWATFEDDVDDVQTIVDVLEEFDLGTSTEEITVADTTLLDYPNVNPAAIIPLYNTTERPTSFLLNSLRPSVSEADVLLRDNDAIIGCRVRWFASTPTAGLFEHLAARLQTHLLLTDVETWKDALSATCCGCMRLHVAVTPDGLALRVRGQSPDRVVDFLECVRETFSHGMLYDSMFLAIENRFEKPELLSVDFGLLPVENDTDETGEFSNDHNIVESEEAIEF